jgi:hypothetical protein
MKEAGLCLDIKFSLHNVEEGGRKNLRRRGANEPTWEVSRLLKHTTMISCFPENIPSTGYSHFAISSSTQTKTKKKLHKSQLVTTQELIKS